jgi:hypothetical protein
MCEVRRTIDRAHLRPPASAAGRATPPPPKITESTTSALRSGQGVQNLPPWMRRLRWDWAGSP